MSGCIGGWAHPKSGKHDGMDLETQISTVAKGALDDAGIGPGERA